MIDDLDDELGLDEISEMISLTPEAARPIGASGVWLVVALIFGVLCVVLAWLHTQQTDELKALHVQVDQANAEAVRWQQANGQVATELVELGHQAALAAELQQSLGNVERAQAELALARKFLDLATQLDPTAATSRQQAALDRIREVERELSPATQRPGSEAEVPATESEHDETQPPIQMPESESTQAETSSPG